MEFRETLLQSEIQHLGNNFRLISEELLILQDFIKEQFGSKFQAFCNARRARAQHQRSSISKSSMKTRASVQQQRSKSSPPISRISGGPTVIRIHSQTEDMTEEEGCILPDDRGEESDSDQEYPMGNLDFEEDDEDVVEMKYEPNLPSPISTEENLFNTSAAVTTEEVLVGKNKGGRQKSIVHKYFDRVKATDGKLKHKCQNCGNIVSSQAQRLKHHILKCRITDSNVIKVLGKLQVSKYKKHKIKNDPTGVKLDGIRTAFQQVKDDEGYNKMECLNCGELVSNQPLRLKNHLDKCLTNVSVTRNNTSNEVADIRTSEANCNTSENTNNDKPQSSSTKPPSASETEDESNLPSKAHPSTDDVHPSSTHHWPPGHADTRGNFAVGQSLIHSPPDGFYQ